MLSVFYESVALAGSSSGSLLSVILGFFVFFLIFAIAIYVFTSFLFMSLAKKAGQSSPGLAWIPMFGPLIIAFKSSGMHWWPWLLYIGVMIPFVNYVFSLALIVFTIVWMWKLFEAVGRPGWWAILLLVPIIGLIMLILAAWTDVGLSDEGQMTSASAV